MSPACILSRIIFNLFALEFDWAFPTQIICIFQTVFSDVLVTLTPYKEGSESKQPKVGSGEATWMPG